MTLEVEADANLRWLNDGRSQRPPQRRQGGFGRAGMWFVCPARAEHRPDGAPTGRLAALVRKSLQVAFSLIAREGFTLPDGGRGMMFAGQAVSWRRGSGPAPAADPPPGQRRLIAWRFVGTVLVWTMEEKYDQHGRQRQPAHQQKGILKTTRTCRPPNR